MRSSSLLSVLLVSLLAGALRAQGFEPEPDPEPQPAPAGGPAIPDDPTDAQTDDPTDAPQAPPRGAAADEAPREGATEELEEGGARVGGVEGVDEAEDIERVGGLEPRAPASAIGDKRERRVGDPIPLTRREPTLQALGFMVGLRYGLVGTGPTRFVNDIRFGITDTIEVRTALLPWPSSLMVRARFGSQQSELGALLVDLGLAHWDAGLRIVPDSGEPQVGPRLHWEAGAGIIRALGERFSVRAHGRYRYRLSFLPDDDQHAVAADAHVTYDLLDALALSAGVGFATAIGPIRELSINFVETDAPGMSHLLARDEGGQQSVTIPLTMTYGRVENFDVDLFCTPRVWPEPGILFGAGVRLRLDPFKG
jgi:hypothetical protein